MNSEKNWGLQIDPLVFKSLKKLIKKEKEGILSTIEELAINPHFGDIQKIKGENNVWRRRIGSYRLFFEIYPEEKIVHIFHVQRRTTTTY